MSWPQTPSPSEEPARPPNTPPSAPLPIPPSAPSSGPSAPSPGPAAPSAGPSASSSGPAAPSSGPSASSSGAAAASSDTPPPVPPSAPPAAPPPVPPAAPPAWASSPTAPTEPPYGPPPAQPPYGPPAAPPPWQPPALSQGEPFVTPPPPPAPLAPADPLRAIAVGLLNLTGLGLGYALIRRWPAMILCWLATGVLLLVALPADPDGVPGGLLAAYLAVLAFAAIHGAVRGLRTPLSWLPQSPVAAAVALVLLAIPVGAGFLYDRAHDEAVEQMLLGRLDQADRLVKTAGEKPFSAAEPDYKRALAAYDALIADHPDSRAAGQVPDRLTTFYKTVARPYDLHVYCDAIAPLKYLRGVPDTVPAKTLGSLTTWPDDRLATSLYQCGTGALRTGASTTGYLDELLTTFPKSTQAAQVEPAISAEIDKAVSALKGSDPCSAKERLTTLGSQAKTLQNAPTSMSAALGKDGDKADKQMAYGTFACGVDQYKDGDFDSALDTLNGFVDDYKGDKNRSLAQKYAIAAEIAQTEPDAGRHTPTLASGGSISVTVYNDSPDAVEVLFTGPVTGRFTLSGCGSCSRYASDAIARLTACSSGKSYPSKTLHLPAGTTYFLHKATGSDSATPGTDTAKLEYGYIYTECAYVVSGYGISS